MFSAVAAVEALQHYLAACQIDGHKSVVRKRIGDFVDFSINHPERMVEPGGLREQGNAKPGRLINKDYRVTMPDGSVWSVPVDVIAINRAKFYVEEGEFVSIGDSLREDTIPLFSGDDYEIQDWAKNNMCWSEVSAIAAMVSPATFVSMREGWINGQAEIVDAE